MWERLRLKAASTPHKLLTQQLAITQMAIARKVPVTNLAAEADNGARHISGCFTHPNNRYRHLS
jgi:hypothetical protein